MYASRPRRTEGESFVAPGPNSFDFLRAGAVLHWRHRTSPSRWCSWWSPPSVRFWFFLCRLPPRHPGARPAPVRRREHVRHGPQLIGRDIIGSKDFISSCRTW